MPEVLRPIVASPRVHQPHDPLPLPTRADEALVDCGVYVDGERLPGKFTYADACSKVHEIELTSPRGSRKSRGDQRDKRTNKKTS